MCLSGFALLVIFDNITMRYCYMLRQNIKTRIKNNLFFLKILFFIVLKTKRKIYVHITY